MLEWMQAILILLGSQPCNASVFGYEGDEMKGGEAVCLHRDLEPGDIGIAHRDLPCGTRVVIENPRTGKHVVAKVVDHGPYGAVYRGRWVLKRRREDRGIWRGCVDLTVRASRLIGHNGFEPVRLFLYKDYGPIVQWQNTTVTRWRQWFDSTWGYQKRNGAVVATGERFPRTE